MGGKRRSLFCRCILPKNCTSTCTKVPVPKPTFNHQSLACLLDSPEIPYHPQLLMALSGMQIPSAEQAVRCLISSLHIVHLVKPAKQPLPWPVPQNPPPLEMTHLLFIKSSTLGFRGS